MGIAKKVLHSRRNDGYPLAKIVCSRRRRGTGTSVHEVHEERLLLLNEKRTTISLAYPKTGGLVPDIFQDKNFCFFLIKKFEEAVIASAKTVRAKGKRHDSHKPLIVQSSGNTADKRVQARLAIVKIVKVVCLQEISKLLRPCIAWNT